MVLPQVRSLRATLAAWDQTRGIAAAQMRAALRELDQLRGVKTGDYTDAN
jgi:biotin carboxylase